MPTWPIASGGGGGYSPGGTDVAVADGGTGASTASAARGNLGVAIGVNVQAWNAVLDATEAAYTAADAALLASLEATVDGLATLASTDSSIIDIYTVAGVTYLDVSGLAGSTGSFLDSAFEIVDFGSGFKATFDTSDLSADRQYSLPDNAGGALVTAASQDVTGRPSFEAGLSVIPLLAASAGIGFGGDNDGSRSNLVEILGNVTYGVTLAFASHRGAAGTPVQSVAGDILGSITARGHTGSGYAASHSTRISTVLTDTVTAIARGAYLTFRTTPTGGTTLTEALRLTADAIPGGVIRGALAVGAGSGMASARTGLGVDITSGGLAVGRGDYTLPNTDVNDLAVPACGMLVLDATALTAGRNITGFTGGVDGRMLIVKVKQGASPFDITFKHENAGSAAANRIYTTNLLDVVGTAAGGHVTTFIYDGTDQRWNIVSARA